MSKTAELIASVLTPLLAANDVDLESLEITPAGKRRVIRIIVDSDGGITLDQVAEVAKEISAELDRLDEKGEMGQIPYVLEVSSPGVDRPLALPRHWRRNITRRVKCSMADGTSLVGRIVAADDAAVEIEIDGISRTVPYEQIAKAHVEVEFNRTGEI